MWPGVVTSIVSAVVTTIGALPYFSSIKMPEVASGILIGTGITLLATGLNELSRFYSSTTELEAKLDLEVFESRVGDRVYKVYRVSALIHNPGNVTIRDAKAVMELRNPDSRMLRDILVKDCGGCPFGSSCSGKPYLVNKVNPVIRGEALPWALPEKPIPRPAGQRYTDYVHITSISPHQSARLLLFEFAPLDGGKYQIRFFSEYGAPGPADPSPRYYRACLYLGEKTELEAEVTVFGEGARRPLRFSLRVRKELLDEVLKHIEKDYRDEDIKVLQKMLGKP